MICRTLDCLPGHDIVVAIGPDAAVIITRVGVRKVHVRVLAPREVKVNATVATEKAADETVSRIRNLIALGPARLPSAV